MACEPWDIRRVLITQIGFVQIVDEAPAVIAERMCVTQVLSISVFFCAPGVGGVVSQLNL